MFLGNAPDLDRRWQIVIVTETILFSLQDMIAMRLGIQFMRQEDAVAHARQQEGVDQVLNTNSKRLDSGQLEAVSVSEGVTEMECVTDKEQILPHVDQGDQRP